MWVRDFKEKFEKLINASVFVWLSFPGDLLGSAKELNILTQTHTHTQKKDSFITDAVEVIESTKRKYQCLSVWLSSDNYGVFNSPQCFGWNWKEVKPGGNLVSRSKK